jgi:hypothetical protein
MSHYDDFRRDWLVKMITFHQYNLEVYFTKHIVCSYVSILMRNEMIKSVLGVTTTDPRISKF